MEWQELKEEFELQGSGIPRSEGLHLTDVISYIEKEMGWDYQGKGFEDGELTMEIGFWWEDMLSYVMAERMATRPGEIYMDGIAGSPDGITIHDDELVLEEYKFTWKAVKNLPVNNWRYMTQIKSYLWMLGLNTCIMKICHCNGDWKGSGPIRKVYRITFDDFELEENWEMILSAKGRMEDGNDNSDTG